MKILDMIAEWRKGCSNAGPSHDQMMQLPAGTSHPVECCTCTMGLIKAIETHETNSMFSARIIPDLHERIVRLKDAAKDADKLGNQQLVVVKKTDLDALLHEFYWRVAEACEPSCSTL